MFLKRDDEINSMFADYCPARRKPSAKMGGGAPALAKYVTSAFPIRAEQKGRRFKARVRRDGAIRYAGKIFKTPSSAAVAACGHAQNGWDFWEFQRAPGDWVYLSTLRA